MNTLILGSNGGRRNVAQTNIGAAVAEFLQDIREEGGPVGRIWEHDCNLRTNKADKPIYAVPTLAGATGSAWADADAIVVTVGKAAIEPFDEQTPDETDELIYANLTLPLLLAKEYVQQRKAAGKRGGTIILVGSYAHRHPFSNGTAYCSAKAGIEMAAKALGWELTSDGYTVLAVHPYHVEGTPMWEEVQRGVELSKGIDREAADAYAKKDLRLPELSKPEDVAAAIGMLLLNRDTARWMSGSSIELNGGVR